MKDPFDEGDRSQGASLDGNWYPYYETGCFRDAAVYHIEGDRMMVRVAESEVKLASGLRVDLTDRETVGITMIPYRNGKEKPERKVEFEDHGSTLVPRWIQFGPDAPRKQGHENLGMSRCATPTLVGEIQHLWREPYDPEATFSNYEL